MSVALFDERGRLVGIAGGGAGLRPIKPGQRRFFTLDFAGVSAEAHHAARFWLSLESD